MTPVIICGGQGTRLWPVSRGSCPKPFSELLDKPLLEKTIERLKPFGQPWLVTAENLRGVVFQSLRALGINKDQILLEPVPRNTAPAIALLCLVLERAGRAREIVGVFPADHMVENETEFVNAIRLAESAAEKGQVCTIGVKPTFPATGFGYIEVDERTFESTGRLAARHVRGFREKPDQKMAEDFLRKGNFFWNAGIFVFRIDTMIASLKEHMPQLWSGLQALKPDFSNFKDVYHGLESKSIDYGVMEKARDQVCVPADLGWSDVGSWDEVSKNPKARKSSRTVSIGGDTNFVFTSRVDKTVGLVDVENLLVVDTEDALLISKKGQSQKVGTLLKDVEARFPLVAREHVFDFRPWGKFETIREEQGYKVKVIRVDVGQQFSYQSHNQRAEHWVLVKGEATVILNEVPHCLKAGEYIFIPKGAKHRMRNEGQVPVEFVEVQIGPYLGEDDIIRYDDDYGRGGKS